MHRESAGYQALMAAMVVVIATTIIAAMNGGITIVSIVWTLVLAAVAAGLTYAIRSVQRRRRV